MIAVNTKERHGFVVMGRVPDAQAITGKVTAVVVPWSELACSTSPPSWRARELISRSPEPPGRGFWMPRPLSATVQTCFAVADPGCQLHADAPARLAEGVLDAVRHRLVQDEPKRHSPVNRKLDRRPRPPRPRSPSAARPRRRARANTPRHRRRANRGVARAGRGRARSR
jgi:hypothetical protein